MTTDREKNRDGETKVPPGAAQDSGPLRDGHPIEPTPPSEEAHPTPEAEARSERIRGGGEPETSDDR